MTISTETLNEILETTPDAFDRYPFLSDFLPKTEYDLPDLSELESDTESTEPPFDINTWEHPLVKRNKI